MKINLYQKVVLTKDIPEEDLKAGDLLTVVEELPAWKKTTEKQVTL